MLWRLCQESLYLRGSFNGIRTSEAGVLSETVWKANDEECNKEVTPDVLSRFFRPILDHVHVRYFNSLIDDSQLF